MDDERYIETFRAAFAASDTRLITRSEIVALGEGSFVQEAIDSLTEAGMIEAVVPDVWMVLTRERPVFEVPRFWSNPTLSDPLTICALVASNPTILDVTRAIMAYGIGVMRQALDACEGEVEDRRIRTARSMTDNAWRGIGNAARRRAAA